MIDNNERDIEDAKIAKRLGEVGIHVNSIYDLVNTSKPYPQAIPVLINLLQEGIISNDRIKEGIIRSLAVKEAKGIGLGRLLIEEFNKIPKGNIDVGWVIGNTMDVIVGEEDIDGILKIIGNKTNGTSRQMFVHALGKIKKPSEEVENVLVDLLYDDDVVVFAIGALAKLKLSKGNHIIKELVNHSRPLVRKTASKAVLKLGII